MAASFSNEEALIHKYPDLYMNDCQKSCLGSNVSTEIWLLCVYVCVEELKCFSSDRLIRQDVV